MKDFIPLYKNPYNNNTPKKDEKDVFIPLYVIRTNIDNNIISAKNRPINLKHRSRIINSK
jgi:hypothetical protein